MRTNSKAYRAKVRAHILHSIYDYGGADDDASRARHIWARFMSEFNYPDNQERFPNTQDRVADWLAGLPLNIAYSNADILALAESWHGESFDGARADRIIESWFKHLAFHLLGIWQDAGINPHRADAQGCVPAWA